MRAWVSCVVPALLLATNARAEAPSSRACIAANERSIELRHDHRLLAARDELVVCSDVACPELVRAECVRHLEEVVAAIPSIVFAIKDSDGADLSAVKITVDGRPLVERVDGSAISIDPGEHKFTFDAEGRTSATRTLVVREAEKGRRESVVLSASEPSSGTPALRIAGITSMAAGVVGVGLGAFFGLRASSLHDDVVNACPAYPTCGVDSANADNRSSQSSALVSTVGFVVGATLLAAGVTLFVIGSSHSSVRATANGLAWGGAF